MMVTYEEKILEERRQGERDGIAEAINNIQSLVDNGMTLENAFKKVKDSVNMMFHSKEKRNS